MVSTSARWRSLLDHRRRAIECPYDQLGVHDGAGAGARYQADPRQLRPGRLGARAGGAGHEPGEPGRLLQAAGPVSTPEERLEELGLSVPGVAAPVAAYIPAIRSGNHVYTSGQLPMRFGRMPHT